MIGIVSSLQLVRPRTLVEALQRLQDDPALVPLAGCTDLYVSLNFGTLAPTRFLDVWGLRSLRRIERREGVLVLGALATHMQLRRSRLVRTHLPMLAAACAEIGGVQIQNRGTLGGNVANASPAGDTLPVLAAAEAVVVLRSSAGERRVPFASFYTGYRQTAMQQGELIVSLEVPLSAGRQWYRKVGTRAAQAISKVVFAGVRAEQPRMALGSVAPTVVRVPHTEAALASGASPDEAARVLQDEIEPIDDMRSTAAYRRAVAGNLLRQFLRETSA